MYKYQHGYAKEANLSADANLTRLFGVVTKMDAIVEGAIEKEVVFVMGATGAGKSTFINYIAGREMTLDTSQLDDAVICKNPLAKIGHGLSSCTSVPELYQEPSTSLILSDCPGYFDTRGIMDEIANAVGIQGMAKKSKQVKGVILIVDRSALTGSRGRGLEEALQSMIGFLGQDLCGHLDSIMLLISKVPDNKIDITFEVIEQETERFPICRELLRKGNVGFYSPLENLRQRKCVLTRTDILAKIKSLKGIPNSEHTFNIGISDSAKLEITGLTALILSKIRNQMEMQNFENFPHLFKIISTLSALNIDRVSCEIEKLEPMLHDHIKLVEHRENAVSILNQLKDLLPKSFMPVIEQTLQRVNLRIEKERQLAEQRANTQAELNQSKQAIAHLQKDQNKLQKDLQEAKISQQEFEKQNSELLIKIENADQNQKTYRDKMLALEMALADANSKTAKEVQKVEAKLAEAEKNADVRIQKLQSDLDSAREELRRPRQEAPRFPVVMYGGPMPYPCYGGGMPMLIRK